MDDWAELSDGDESEEEELEGSDSGGSGGLKSHENLACINSLTPWRCGCNLKLAIFKLISRREQKSALVQVMAWCRQAPSHFLNQC